MMTLERRHDLITVLKPYFSPKRLHSTKSFFIKAIDHTFYGFTGVITHLGCWENTRKACKSLAFGSWFTSFPRVLPTSRVGYHAGKPIESVIYCLRKRGCLGKTELKMVFTAIQRQNSWTSKLYQTYEFLLKLNAGIRKTYCTMDFIYFLRSICKIKHLFISWIRAEK